MGERRAGSLEEEGRLGDGAREEKREGGEEVGRDRV